VFVQQLSPNGTETLLDHHLPAFDRWLQLKLQHWNYLSSSLLLYCLTVITIVDQLNVDSEGFNWQAFFVPLVNKWVPIIRDLKFVVHGLTELFVGMEPSQMACSRIVSKFLTNPGRAGDTYCVDSWAYMNLSKKLLQILRNQ